MFSIRVARNNQYACKTILEAERQFEKSCNMCAMSPSCYIDCDHCELAELHKCIVEDLKKNIASDYRG